MALADKNIVFLSADGDGTRANARGPSGVRIRSHLLLMVGGALLPLLLFSSALTGYSWWQQRNTVEQRQLERVRAVTISIDTEIQAIVQDQIDATPHFRQPAPRIQSGNT